MNANDDTGVVDREDRELVARFLKTREEQVFRVLYRRHTPRLFLFCLRLCGGDHPNAEDVVQEAWIRAVTNLSTFLWKSKLSSWLAAIALNCYREKRGSLREIHASISDPGVMANDDLALDLEAFIRRLPDGCREVFLLHDLEGYTHAEIGMALNISNGTSKSQLFDARKKLRQWLNPDRRKENVR